MKSIEEIKQEITRLIREAGSLGVSIDFITVKSTETREGRFIPTDITIEERRKA